MRISLRIVSFAFLTFILCSAFVPKPGSKEKGITVKETLEFLNKKIDKSIRFEQKKGGILISFYKNSSVFRQDLVFPEDLDVASVKYLPEEKIFSIKCMDGSKCVDRQLFERDIRRNFGRFSVAFEGDAKSIESVRQAFVHLLRSAQEDDYSRTEPFE